MSYTMQVTLRPVSNWENEGSGNMTVKNISSSTINNWRFDIIGESFQINKIWNFRQQTTSNVCFTLDAGANVHVLYPENETEQVIKFIQNELVAHCQNGHYICDRIGFGANQINI